MHQLPINLCHRDNSYENSDKMSDCCMMNSRLVNRVYYLCNVKPKKLWYVIHSWSTWVLFIKAVQELHKIFKKVNTIAKWNESTNIVEENSLKGSDFWEFGKETSFNVIGPNLNLLKLLDIHQRSVWNHLVNTCPDHVQMFYSLQPYSLFNISLP